VKGDISGICDVGLKMVKIGGDLLGGVVAVDEEEVDRGVPGFCILIGGGAGEKGVAQSLEGASPNQPKA